MSYIIVYLEPDTCYPGLVNGIPSRDQEPETVWLSTGSPVSGGIPYDILYVDDEMYPLQPLIFIYTERKLLSYYLFEYEWGPTINLSEYGSQTLSKFTDPLLPRSREKHLAYNLEKHELYCITQDLKILVIDPFSLLTMPVIEEIVPDTDIDLLDWAIIKYDPVSEFLFLGLCNKNSYTPKAELIASNTEDYSNEYSISDLETLNDISFNPESNLLYLSSDDKIQVRNTSDGFEINSFAMPCNMSVIFNAYNSLNLNKIYYLPKSDIVYQDNALIFNGINTNPQTISLERYNFGCGTYNPQSNKIYIGYTSTNSLPSGFISFDAETGNMTDHTLENDDIIMDMVNLDERVYISTKDHIYCCKNGSYYPDYTLDSPNSYFYRIAATNFFDVPRIWATNLMEQSLQITYAFSTLSDMEWFEPELLSGTALQGFFNHMDNKLYLYYGMPEGVHKYMYIYDPETEIITSVKMNHDPIGGVFILL